MNERETWGLRLKRARKARKLLQHQCAAKLGATQPDLSNWEAGKKSLPSYVREFIELAERQLNLLEKPLQEEVRSRKFCYGATTFRRVWDESDKRIRKMAADYVIRPCKRKTRGFADVDLTIQFEGVELPPEDPLYLDCVGVISELEWKGRNGNFYAFDKRKGSVASWVGHKTYSNQTRLILGKVEEVKKVQATLGPYAIGYQLLNVVEDELIEVKIHGERGVRTDRLDAVGVPVYGDAPVELLILSVTFENLTPWPKPKAKVWPLRRTLTEARPLHLAGGLEITEIDEKNHKCSFQVRYPKPGGFCIAWGSLK